jgi:hypothetical protein
MRYETDGMGQRRENPDFVAPSNTGMERSPIYGTRDKTDLWDIPEAPQAPRAGEDYMTSQEYYAQNGEQGGYTPPTAVGPTADWYNNMSPEIMAGLNAPWNQAQDQMFETMGGQAGSGRGGFSGAGGAAYGSFMADKATQMPMQAWGMSQPGLQANWQAQNQGNFGDYVAGQERTGADYGNYQQGIQQDYGMNQNIWQEQARQASMPYDILPGLMGGTYSNPIVDPGGPGAASMAGGGLMAAGSVPSAASPYLLAGGAALSMYGQYG